MAAHADLPTVLDDGALARACVAGDPEAFALLYRRYFPDLVRFMERRGNDHGRAEDIAQETLARALRYLPGFDASRPLWPWLRTIAVRIAGNEAAARTSEVLVCDTPEGRGADDPVDAVAARSMLVESLRRLPDRQRDALVMRYVQDRQPADIAAVLGMSKNSFDQLLFRARRGLAKEYGRLSGAVLVPLSLRMRRAAHWVDTRIGAAFAGVISNAADFAVGAVVVVASATAAISAVGTSPAAAAPVALAGAEAPSLAAVRRGANDITPGAPTARTPVARKGSEDIVIERKVNVGPAAARSRTRVSGDPARGELPEEENEHVLDVPLLGPVRTGGSYQHGGGPGYICRNTGVCLTRP